MRKRKQASQTLTADTCRELTKLIGDYIAGKLEPRVKREFKQHLQVCPDCVNFLKSYKKTVDVTGALDPIIMPARVRDTLLAFLRKKIQRVAAFLVYVASQFFT